MGVVLQAACPHAAFQTTNYGFQCFDPLAEANGIVSLMRDEVNVVGHDDEAATEPTVTRRVVEEERNQSLKCGFVVEDAPTTIHANRQERTNRLLANPLAEETNALAQFGTLW